MQDEFQHFASQLIKDIGLLKLKKHCKKRDQIKAYYSPAQKYKRWRDSKEGQQWKEAQYKIIDGKCPKCGHCFPLQIFEIDHIEPISKSPELATNPQNLQLLCPPCNKQKSNVTQ
jgi:5-methylcytosine-specific restriction endonuclease McrA